MDTDIVIDGCRCVCTCSACPEQYNVFDESSGEQIGYLRLRHGEFRAHFQVVGGPVVYSSSPRGDGCFFDEAERAAELSAAIAAIKERRSA
jgi:hypothetical protein